MYEQFIENIIGEGNDNPLQYACLGNPTDKGAWWAIVHGVAESQTGLNNNNGIMLMSTSPLTFNCVTEEHVLVGSSQVFRGKVTLCLQLKWLITRKNNMHVCIEKIISRCGELQQVNSLRGLYGRCFSYFAAFMKLLSNKSLHKRIKITNAVKF